MEHLRLWHTWNDDPASPFYGLVDRGRIALIGHSRGGDAVVVAAAFNRLPYSPDDARDAFDYGYAIQAVAAIAPVDGQYTPGGVGTSIQDVSYLALHDAHDMDVISYMAARQYERVSLSGEGFNFKAGLYVDGANLAAFLGDNPAFNPSALNSVRLVFDCTPEGVVVLDHAGLRQD